MLFDNKNPSDSRLKTHSSYNNFIEDFSSSLENSLNNFNESFYNESMELLPKELFAKLNESNAFMNEAVGDFLTNFQSSIIKLTSDLDTAFEKYSKIITLQVGKDKKIIDAYRDEFMATQNMEIECYDYNLDNNDIPNFKILNDMSTFKVDIKKLNVSKLKRYKKEDSYYDKIRGEILLYNNKGIKYSNFKKECYKVFHNGNPNKIRIELNPKMKIQILNIITTCELQLLNTKKDLDTIKDFIRMTMKNIVNEYQFISKHKDMTDYEYDAYTSFIYNKVNELRNVISIYELAYSYKMDIIKQRREEYLDIFKNTVKNYNTLSESINIYFDKYYDSYNEDYNIDMKEFNEAFNRFKLDLESSMLISSLYNENTILNEGILDQLKQFIQSLFGKLGDITQGFLSKSIKDFDSKFNRAEFDKMDFSKMDKNYKVYTYNYSKMLECINSLDAILKGFSTTGGSISNIAKDVSKEYSENFDSFVVEMRKEKFGKICKNANDEDFKDKGNFLNSLKNGLLGEEQSEPKQIIDNAFKYCPNETYKKNKEPLVKCKKNLEDILKNITNFIKEAERLYNTKKTKTEQEVNKNESYVFLETDSNEKALDENNKKAKEQNEKKAYDAKQDAKDLVDKASDEEYNETMKKIKFLQKLFGEASGIQNAVWVTYESGRSHYIGYLIHLKKLEMIKKGKIKNKDEDDKKKK